MERRGSASLFLRIQTSHNSFHVLPRRLTCLTRTPSTPPLLYVRGGGILFLEKLLSLKYPQRETLVFSQFLRRRSRELTRRCACRPLGFITPPRKDNGSLRVRVAIPSCMIALLLSVGFSSSRREPLDLGDDQALQAMANPVSRVGNRGRKGGLARKKNVRDWAVCPPSQKFQKTLQGRTGVAAAVRSTAELERHGKKRTVRVCRLSEIRLSMKVRWR